MLQKVGHSRPLPIPMSTRLCNILSFMALSQSEQAPEKVNKNGDYTVGFPVGGQVACLREQ
jgi:hypothetical protein